MLSDQIATDRLFDAYRRAREASHLALNDAAWRNQYNNLVNQYNRLLRDANRLADVQDRALANNDRQIAELKATNAALLAQNEKLTLELASAKASVKLWKRLDRELHPEVYRSVYEDE
jgi:TRAP-type mannitol/chloroaromatic compound transport system substrate-binding protein